MSVDHIRVRLLFADAGAFHHEEVLVPASSVSDYGRLIDGLREDPEFLRQAYLDVNRLCGAWVVEEEA